MTLDATEEVSNQPIWRQLSEPSSIAEALCDVYRNRGVSNYDESVSQNEHAMQAGALALAEGASDETVIAAFLHDIGHLLMNEHDDNGDFLQEDRHHENVAARFLANWFDDAVTTPIRLHVPAKRYLCATEAEYFDGLSDASVRSLEVQGGPMSEDEVAEFESVEYFETAVNLRRWDDLAKVKGVPTPEIDFFETLIKDHLTA